MAQGKTKLDWCVVRLGEDMNWWVEEISDPVHWDVDGLGIIDPRQISYILELCEGLREYGFDTDALEEAFYAFAIEEELKGGQVRVIRTQDSLLEDNATLFALPDVVDEEKGPYADLLDQVTRYRVKLLNDLIEFDQSLTIEELEDEIRERQNQDYMEGRAVHPFTELTNVLEYVPEGFEIEDSEESRRDEDDIDDIPEFEEEEKLEEDETMRWDEDEDEDEDEEFEEEGEEEKE